jgi:hypothetical protein
MSSCASKPNPYAPLTFAEIEKSFARKMIPLADSARALGVRMGIKTYEVRIVRTAWTGDYRGEGMEYVVEEHQLTPTPLVTGLDNILQATEGVGQIEQGNVNLSEISGRYTEDFLRGFGIDGTAPGPNEQVFYEIRYPTADGDGIRRRFYLRSGPSYFADTAEWKLGLERQVEDRPPERY